MKFCGLDPRAIFAPSSAGRKSFIEVVEHERRSAINKNRLICTDDVDMFAAPER